MKRFFSMLLTLVAALSFAPAAELSVAFRRVDIPLREHGYFSLQSSVIRSAEELQALLDAQAENTGWNNPEGFRKALLAADIDWQTEALVLLLHSESSGSIRIHLGEPVLKDGTLTLPLARKQPQGFGTADMAGYAFALVLNRQQVQKVILAPEGRDPTAVTLK
jgi:hypothetical protein